MADVFRAAPRRFQALRRAAAGAAFAVVALGLLVGRSPAQNRPASHSAPNRPVDVRQFAAQPPQELGEPLEGRPPFGAVPPDGADAAPPTRGLDLNELVSPGGLPATLRIMALLTVLSLAPSILMMTTCFIRFVIVLALLRQALGTQQLPPNQVIVSLCLFLTFAVMAPVWQQSYDEGIRPYTQPAPGQPVLTLEDAFRNTVRPLRTFMLEQIEMTGNTDGIFLLLEYQQPASDPAKFNEIHYDDIPLSVLLPAYVLSELKTAFVIGFQIYLPFVIIDMVISSVLISMGMMMLPPVLISLPFKLLLFVLIDGWFLTVGMLIESVRPGFG